MITGGDGSTFFTGSVNFNDPEDKRDFLAGWFQFAQAHELAKIAKTYDLCFGISEIGVDRLKKIKSGHPLLPPSHSYASPITAKMLQVQAAGLEELLVVLKDHKSKLRVTLNRPNETSGWMGGKGRSIKATYFDDPKRLDPAGYKTERPLKVAKVRTIVEKLQNYMGLLRNTDAADGTEEASFKPIGRLNEVCAVWYGFRLWAATGRKKNRVTVQIGKPVEIPVVLLGPAPENQGAEPLVKALPVHPAGPHANAAAKAFVQGFQLRFLMQCLPESDAAKESREALLKKQEFAKKDMETLAGRLGHINVRAFGAAGTSVDGAIELAFRRLRNPPPDPETGETKPVLPPNAFLTQSHRLREPLKAARKIPGEVLERPSPKERRILKAGKQKKRIRKSKQHAEYDAVFAKKKAREEKQRSLVGKVTLSEPMAVFTPTGELLLLTSKPQVKKWVAKLNLLESLNLAGVHLNRDADQRRTQKDGSVFLNLQSLGFPTMSEIRAMLGDGSYKDIVATARQANTCADSFTQMQYLSLVHQLAARAAKRAEDAREAEASRSDEEQYLKILADKSAHAAVQLRNPGIHDSSHLAIANEVGAVWSQRDARDIIKQNETLISKISKRLAPDSVRIFHDCLPDLLDLEYARQFLDPGHRTKPVERTEVTKDINRVLIDLKAKIDKPEWRSIKLNLTQQNPPSIPDAGADLLLLIEQIQAATKAVQQKLEDEGLAADATANRKDQYCSVQAKDEVFVNYMTAINTGTDLNDIASGVFWVNRIAHLLKNDPWDWTGASDQTRENLLWIAQWPMAITFGALGIVENVSRGMQVSATSTKLKYLISQTFSDEFIALEKEIRENTAAGSSKTKLLEDLKKDGAVHDQKAIHAALHNIVEKKEADVFRREVRVGLSIIATTLTGASAGTAIPVLAIIGGIFGAAKTLETIYRLLKDHYNEVSKLRYAEARRMTSFAQAGVAEALQIGRMLEVLDFTRYPQPQDQAQRVNGQLRMLAFLLKHSDWADKFTDKYVALSAIK